jgi:hypothetical protein
VNDGIQLATEKSGKNYVQTVSWQDFIADHALSYPDAQEGLMNGLWNYVQGYWKKYDLPKNVKPKDKDALIHLESLINVTWLHQETQTRAFIKYFFLVENNNYFARSTKLI